MSKEYSLKMEQDEARRDGAVPVSNSGRGLFKCDAILDDFGIDYKHTQKSFTINLATWAKATKDAMSQRKLPTIKIIFWSVENENKTRLWLIRDEEMHDYLRLLRKEQDEQSQ